MTVFAGADEVLLIWSFEMKMFGNGASDVDWCRYLYSAENLVREKIILHGKWKPTLSFGRPKNFVFPSIRYNYGCQLFDFLKFWHLTSQIPDYLTYLSQISNNEKRGKTIENFQFSLTKNFPSA